MTTNPEKIAGFKISRQGFVHACTDRGLVGGWTLCGAGTRDMADHQRTAASVRDCRKCFKDGAP